MSEIAQSSQRRTSASSCQVLAPVRDNGNLGAFCIENQSSRSAVLQIETGNLCPVNPRRAGHLSILCAHFCARDRLYTTSRHPTQTNGAKKNPLQPQEIARGLSPGGELWKLK